MGVWEQMSEYVPSTLSPREFSFEPPRRHGTDALQTIRGRCSAVSDLDLLRDGRQLRRPPSPTPRSAEAAMRGNVAERAGVDEAEPFARGDGGSEALILPTLGRTEVDVQAIGGAVRVGGGQRVRGARVARASIPPVAPGLLSEIAIVSRLARATLGAAGAGAGARGGAGAGTRAVWVPGASHIDWTGFRTTTTTSSVSTSRRVVPGFENVQRRRAAEEADSCCRTVRATQRHVQHQATGQGDAHRESTSSRSIRPAGPPHSADACARTTSSTRPSTA